jgi:PadR family transcriptional regulator PadR
LNLNNWQTQLRKGLLDIVILNLLQHGRCHGYEMVQILKQKQDLIIREGNIYAILTRLEADGLVTGYSETSLGGPPRRYFRLTKSGRKTLDEMNAHWDQIIEIIRDIRKGPETCTQKEKNGTDSEPNISARWKKHSRSSKAPV